MTDAELRRKLRVVAIQQPEMVETVGWGGKLNSAAQPALGCRRSVVNARAAE